MNDIKNFLDSSGRLKQFPAKRKMKLQALVYLAGKFQTDKIYSERQVNDILCNWHTFNDPATLRRELYNNRFVDRKSDGSEYCLAKPQPVLEELEKRYS